MWQEILARGFVDRQLAWWPEQSIRSHELDERSIVVLPTTESSVVGLLRVVEVGRSRCLQATVLSSDPLLAHTTAIWRWADAAATSLQIVGPGNLVEWQTLGLPVRDWGWIEVSRVHVLRR